MCLLYNCRLPCTYESHFGPLHPHRICSIRGTAPFNKASKCTHLIYSEIKRQSYMLRGTDRFHIPSKIALNVTTASSRHTAERRIMRRQDCYARTGPGGMQSSIYHAFLKPSAQVIL